MRPASRVAAAALAGSAASALLGIGSLVVRACGPPRPAQLALPLHVHTALAIAAAASSLWLVTRRRWTAAFTRASALALIISALLICRGSNLATAGAAAALVGVGLGLLVMDCSRVTGTLRSSPAVIAMTLCLSAAIGDGTTMGAADLLFTGAIFLLALAELLGVPGEGEPGELVGSQTPGGVLLRWLIVPSMLLPPAFAWLKSEAVEAGRLDLRVGAALMAVAFSSGMVLLTLRTARSLDQGDRLRRGVEARLRAREEQLATTLRSIGDAVVTTDRDGWVTSLNPEAERLSGWSDPRARGCPLTEVIQLCDESTGAPVEDPAAGLLRHGAATRLAEQYALVALDGMRRPIAGSAAPIRGADGSNDGMVVVFRDVSAQREAQQQLQLADRLATIGRVAAGVCHEINNPLTYVLGNVQYASRTLAQLRAADAAESPQLRRLEEALAEAALGAERVSAIVGDLRRLSRGDPASGRRRTTVDVRQVLEEAINMASNEIRHRGKLVREIQPVPLIMGDRGRLGQVFINLLLNAAQALPPDRDELGEIRVRAETRGELVEVSVIDTGAGIAPEALPRIFEPFYSTKRTAGGTGLGLAICREIVEELGGEITIDSRPGAGTTVRVALPACDAAPEPEREPAEPTVGSGARARIMVVDDQRVILKVIERILTPDHEVDTYDRMDDALARLATGEVYDLILCDLMMPNGNGIDFHREVQRLAPEMLRRIAFMTGGAFTPEARAFLAMIDTPCLEKPFTLDGFHDFLRRVIRS